MNTFKKILFLFSLILISSCAMNKENQIDQIFENYNLPGMPGAAVAVIENGNFIFNKGYGLAVVEEKIPVTDSTDFRLASVTKQFTAMCVLQLIEKGQLKFETTLTDIFPDFPTYGKEITIKNILQHTSGLVDYESLIADTVTVQVKDKDVLKMMMSIDSVYFAPGEQHRYSNTGYALLTQVIEKVTGMPFRDYLKENIFNRLGMKNTLAYEKGINTVPNRAYGYTIKDRKVERTDQSITSAVLGDGGIYSNLKDLLKWDQSLYNDELISKSLLEKAFTKGVLNSGEEFNYGFGWRLETYKELKIIYHTGSTRGFRNIIYRIPEKNFTAIILTNRDADGEYMTLNLAHKIVDLWF